eukprot:11976356-Alexandrium_andersonii.AAC.1
MHVRIIRRTSTLAPLTLRNPECWPLMALYFQQPGAFVSYWDIAMCWGCSFACLAVALARAT